MHIALAIAVLLHMAAGGLLLFRPPGFLVHPIRVPPPHEAQIELIQNDKEASGDAPTGGASTISKQRSDRNKGMPEPQSERPQTAPLTSSNLPIAPAGELPPPRNAPFASGGQQSSPDSSSQQEVTATDPVQQPAQHDDTPTIRLSNSDEEEGLSGGSAETAAVPDPKIPNKLPAYPHGAAQAGEQGEVDMIVHVSPDGTAAAVVVAGSSGSPTLDTAAVRAVQRWRFRPARDHGTPVESEVRQTLNFVLRNKLP